MVTRICTITKQPFTISNREVAFCEENGIPLPTIAPYERLRNMLSFYNSIFLYNSTCDLTKKPMLSIVPPTKETKAYDAAIWMDENAWDPMTFGRDYDFSRPFFEQMRELQLEVPTPSRSVVLSTMENSDYTNGISSAKNCYLIFDSNESEDCYFCYQLSTVKNIVDSIGIRHSELCYACKYVDNCYNLKFAENCTQCSDSTFLFNCRSLKNCFGCTNLNHKEYCWYNEQLTKEEFERRSAQLNLGSYSGLEAEKKQFEQFKKLAFVKSITGISNENSTGNYINECKDCDHVFFTNKAENCEYSIRASKGKNCFYYSIFGLHAELVYNSQTCGHSAYNLKFCLGCFVNVRDLEYCMHVGFGSSNCFGCISLRKKEYCILNKQYTKEDYIVMVRKIKKHMMETGEYGQWFPNNFSPCYYNKSEAISFFPLTREEALERGFCWEDEDIEEFEQTYIIPEHIDDVQDDILNSTLKCPVSGKKYRIIKQELELYRKFQLPIPRIAPLERLRLNCLSLQMPTLIDRACNNCQTRITTCYSDKEQIVYCEKCYAEKTA